MSSKKGINIAVLIMAAGGSTRLDSPKQLLQWGKDYLINHIIQTALSANIGPITVVLGSRVQEIQKILLAKNLQLVINPDWQSGMSSSIKVGIASLESDVDAALIMLVDQPFVTSGLLSQLVLKMTDGNYEITAPRVAGQQCNPVLFSRSLFAEIMKISGDRGAKTLIKDRQVGWVDWPDERLILDIDSKEDYRNALRLNKS